MSVDKEPVFHRNPYLNQPSTGVQPQWVQKHNGRNREERREQARRKGVRPAPGVNRPYRKDESR